MTASLAAIDDDELPKPRPGYDLETVGRLLRWVRRSDSGCLEWVGTRGTDGYGVLRALGKQMRAHRLSYLLFVGDLPVGQLICHRCDNPICVEPSHLFPGSPADNMRDKVRKNRVARGERFRHAKLTDDAVRQIRSAIAGGELQYKLAERFGVSRTIVSLIHRGQLWRHVQ